MKKEQYDKSRQLIKNTALNAIAKIYHPKYKFPYSNYYTEDGGYAEQRENYTEGVIKKMNRELDALKLKYKKYITTKKPRA